MTRTTRTPTQPIRTGSLKLGAGQNDNPFYKTLFRVKKKGFEYLGQVCLDLEAPSVKVEMFNPNYFETFESESEMVVATLERQVLSLVSRKGELDDRFKKLIRAHLKSTSLEEPIEEEIETEGVEDERDIQNIFDRLNQEYFFGEVEAAIEWGKDSQLPNRRSVNFGSYDDKKKLIRIHPRLNQSFVPVSVLELTVYHEMCHQFVPPVRRNGQWQSHHKEFKRKEREYRNYREAMQWEKKNWMKLLAPISE